MKTIKEKKFKNRQVLIEAALEEFSQYNYEAASLNRIIKSSGTSKGSFYYHFINKEDLYIQLLQASVEAKWKFIHEYSKDNGQDFTNMDLFDKFLFQAESGVRFSREYPKYNKLGNMFAKEKGSKVYDKAVKLLNADSGHILTQMIEQAYQDHEIDPYYSLEFVIALVSHMFESFHDIFKKSENMVQELSNLKAYVAFMKRGLKKAD